MWFGTARKGRVCDTNGPDSCKNLASFLRRMMLKLEALLIHEVLNLVNLMDRTIGSY
jgi:hypothetical protein